ncbi:MAG TPA: metal ABC transporter substrate-binding protein [Candidatus Binatia bacterium]|nr:metal ABC transporter substrate-binding protein [Candidatus Binatia bacterium]
MRRIFQLLLCLVIPSAPLAAAEPISVVTTTADIAAIVKAVGGDRVAVDSIAKGYQDPHFVEAKPSYVRVVNRARMLFNVGLELEVGWLPLLVQGSRNPALVVVDLSPGISVLEKPSGPISRAQGDVHPLGNPHYWLDPRNGVIMARRVAQELKAAAPGETATFEQNLKLFENDLSARRKRWEEQMAPLRGTEIVTYHKEWEYLMRWLGLSIIGYVEDKPGIPPSPKHLEELVQTMRQRKVKALIASNYTNPNVPRSIAEKTGAKLLVLPTSVGGEETIRSYSELFDAIVGKLVNALK